MSEAVPTYLPNTARGDAPAVLLPYQQEWIAIESPLKVGEKARRIGLTWAEAADDVLIAAAEEGQNCYYIGYNQDMAVEYIEAAAMWARAFNQAASEIEEGLWEDDQDDKHIKTYTIRFPGSGRRIVALSSRPANLRGKQGVCVIDEAAFHDQLGELLKAALAFLIWGGKVRVLSTHDGVGNPFNELIQAIKSKKRKGVVFRCTFQEAVEQGLFQRVCLRLGKSWTAEGEAAWVKDVYDFYGDDAEEELDVVPRESAGAYLPGALIEARMAPDIPVVRLARPDSFAEYPEHLRHAEIEDWCRDALLPLLETLDADREHCFGEDFARSGDLTVLAVGEIVQDMTRRTRFMVELRNMPFAQQRQIIWYILDRLPRFRAAAFDGRGNGQQIAEETADRYWGRIHTIMISDRFYAEEFPALKRAFEDGTIEIPRDADVKEDLRAVQVIGGTPKVPKTTGQGKKGEKRHGDAAIALLMMWFASCRDSGGPVEYESLARRRFSSAGDDDDDSNAIYRQRGAY